VEKLEHLLITSGKVKWHSHCRKQTRGYPKNQTEISNDPTTPILHNNPKELKARTQRLHVHPWSQQIIYSQKVETTNELIKYHANKQYYSDLRKKEILTHATT
jgi:hypothetical protein